MVEVVRSTQRAPHTGAHAVLQESAVGWWGVQGRGCPSCHCGPVPLICHWPPPGLLEGLAGRGGEGEGPDGLWGSFSWSFLIPSAEGPLDGAGVWPGRGRASGMVARGPGRQVAHSVSWLCAHPRPGIHPAV